MRKVTHLIILIQILLSLQVLGMVGSMPSFDDLMMSDVVVLAKKENIRIEFERGCPGFEISLFGVVKGVCPVKKLKLQSQKLFFLPTARSYLIFLKQDQGKMSLTSNACSVIPIGTDTVVEGRSFENKGAATKLLGKLLAHESDKVCALVQSYMLADGTSSELMLEWENIKKNCDVKSYDMQLAIANIGLRVIGLQSLDIVKSSPEQLPSIGTATEALNAIYRLYSQLCIVRWIQENASHKNSAEILEYAIKCDETMKMGFIDAAGKYIESTSIPLLIPLLKSQTESVMIKYCCLKAVMYSLNDGRGIITIDEFRKKPEEALKPVFELLKKHFPKE